MERVDLGVTAHAVRRWWVRGDRGELGHAVVGLGQLEGSGWFVAKAEHGTNMAWMADDERHACEVVQRWINRRGGTRRWRELAGVYPAPTMNGTA